MIMIKKITKEGTALITILMVIIVCTVLALSVVNLNTSQVIFTEKEIKHVHSEIQAMGALHLMFSTQLSDTPTDAIIYTTDFENTTYNNSATIARTGSGPSGTNILTITSTF